VEALHKLLTTAPEGVNLHQSSARKQGAGNRISGSSATQQRTRVNLSQAAEGRPAWLWPAVGAGALAVGLAAWLMLKPGVPAVDPGTSTPVTTIPGEGPANTNPDVATNASGDPLTVQFGNANAGEAPVALGADEVNDLLTRADVYLQEGTSPDSPGRHLVFPADDSALYLYRQVLASDPQNARALAGVDSVRGYYRRLAHKACSKGLWTQCAIVAQKGLDEVDQADETLLGLRAAAQAGERGESPTVPALPD
jgi:hypothetical protein